MPVRSYGVGWATTDTPGELVGIHGEANSGGAGEYTTCDRGASGYQVPVGKTFYITSVIFSGDAAGARFFIGYGDNDVGVSQPAPTNPVPITAELQCGAGDTTYQVMLWASVPAGKYPFIRCQTSVVKAHIVGIEV